MGIRRSTQRSKFHSRRLAFATAVGAGVLAALAASSAGGCSLLLDLKATQCTTTSDCVAAGSDFASYICDTTNNVCVPPTVGKDSGPTGCTTNKACSDEHQQLPYICKTPGSDCTRLYSDDCYKVIGNFQDDNPLILGTLISRQDGSDAYGEDEVAGVELATSEITKSAVGLPIGDASSRRPLVFLVCDYQNYDRAYKHLVDDIGVPAIVGPSTASQAISLALSPNFQTMMLMPGNDATAVLGANFDDKGLVWETEALDTADMGGVARLLPTFEAAYKNDLGVTDLKVAMVVEDTVDGQGFVDVGLQTLVFNGKKAVDNGSNFKASSYNADNPDFSPIINDLLDFQPNVVVVTTEDAKEGVIVPVEKSWPANVPKPEYVMFSDNHSLAMINTIGNADFPGRLFAFAYGSPPPPKDGNFKNFIQRFIAKYNRAPTTAAATAYDAAYMLAYASVGAGNVPVLTGKDIANGMRKLLPPGKTINVGGSSVGEAFTPLLLGDSIDFEGAFGSYNFDQYGAADSYFMLLSFNDKAQSHNCKFLYWSFTGDLLQDFDATACPLP